MVFYWHLGLGMHAEYFLVPLLLTVSWLPPKSDPRLSRSRNFPVTWVAQLPSGNVHCKGVLFPSHALRIYSQSSAVHAVWAVVCLIFKSIQWFFNFYVVIQYSLMDKSSQCESLYTVLLFTGKSVMLAKPLFHHPGEKNPTTIYFLILIFSYYYLTFELEQEIL